ncbi:hypothetical protein [Chelativorans sp. YIM 93263]|uniref:hypothetical protein n=1 Tax=Chelativorans sp. YIM 93263 TaxID=2906648 RepID=UPI002379181E|nr:hypothetical protein [Chelativorans sp. YIM 93263]
MKRIISFWSVAGAISVATFVSIEIAAAATAAVWALSGVLGLGQFTTVALAVLIGLPSVYAIFIVARLSFLAETDPQNNYLESFEEERREGDLHSVT